MSWLVETLLLDRARIRASNNINSNEFNNLLDIENKLYQLLELGLIDNFEFAIVNYVISNKPYSELEELLQISRNTISKYFRKICNKVSYALGGHFTDEGYLEYMRSLNSLTEEQVNKMREHMNSQYRHTIRR